MENIKFNPLLCDIETGVCEIPAAPDNREQKITVHNEKPLTILYFTDPICSSCWGIEPQLRKLKLEYGHLFEINYRMGGLLPDWSYNSGGISKPSDVAHHWDEVSARYDMPIDGDVWLEDPLPSSYPPSIAFKAAQLQHKEKAIQFLRHLRELVFLQKKNITKWEYLNQAAEKAGLNAEQMKTDYAGAAKNSFEEDLQLAQKLGVRGFPTMFFIDSIGNEEKVYGTKPYSAYEHAITSLHSSAAKYEYAKDWDSLFSKYATLTSKEFTELSQSPRASVDPEFDALYNAGKLDKLTTKNGPLWIKK